MSYNEKEHRKLVIESVIKDARKGCDVYDEDDLEQDGPDLSNTRHYELENELTKRAWPSEGSYARRAAKEVFEFLDKMEGWLKEEGGVSYDAHFAIYELEDILNNLRYTDEEQEAISKCIDDLCNAYGSKKLKEALRAVRRAKNTFSSLPTFSRGRVLNSLATGADARRAIMYNQDYKEDYGDSTDEMMRDKNIKKKQNMETRKKAGYTVSNPRYKRRLPKDSDFYAGD